MKALSIFLILVYQAVAFKPLLTIIDFEINRDYIASTLCENRTDPTSSCGGKCYLTKRLKNITAEPFEKKNTPKKQNITEEEELHKEQDTLVSPRAIYADNQRNKTHYLLKENLLFPEVTSPPPQA